LISNLEKKIVFTYLKSRKRDGFLNIISIFSFVGIGLGVAVLIIVMSVMNGFRNELISKIVGFSSHATIQSYNQPIDLNKLNKSSFIENVKLHVLSNNGESIIINKDNTKGIHMRGYLDKDFGNLELVNSKNFNGNKSLPEKSISIGNELSFLLDVKIGDKLTIMTPSGIETILGKLPSQKTFLISSIYNTGIIDFDSNVVFINLNDLEGLLQLDNNNRNVEVYFNDYKEINFLKKELEKIFPDEYIYTWADINKSLFSALKVERNVMFIIMSLIIIVAAFNIISGLTIFVKNKTREIAILKSIGVSSYTIKKIFFLIGFFIGTFATIFGVILGVLFSIYIEKIRILLSTFLNLNLFPEEIYFLSKMPSEINIESVLLISLCSIFVTCLVSVYPASKASKLDPARGLQYD
tara:strand:+ start:369 stop:1598 length:1230 start_codon:yes stop_codon:yes gene_type:complete